MLVLPILMATFGTCIYRFIMQFIVVVHKTNYWTYEFYFFIHPRGSIMLQMFTTAIVLVLLFMAVFATIVLTGLQFYYFIIICIGLGIAAAETGNYILRSL